ncbi:hypothetical protein MHM84_12295 [Halomonas sp. McH1-25]|uniref:hypothetical protein n=1 Tax=unclassified Halomonas TaxID=2609666 RepID=UPI001EF423F3|nr:MULTISPECIES: hypothetical protein [unclassified Halomonas]MCG7600572.1 hypothetical protein [Halomonas sp. McH1-25]MCP1342039.1 hypothetical protein [Halomonas sp. FL8]MCP1359892.1 hypothetical protein [Halomonas sp. BBD45]MCP1364274.1 hypothetical protein [Halomonas sp. BBD48]
MPPSNHFTSRPSRALSLIAAAGAALLLGSPAQAAWQLMPEQSRVEATVVEISPTGPVPHTHRVGQLSGVLGSDGILRVPLRLRQTDILDRVGQLPPLLSGLADTTLTTVTIQLPPERLDNLNVGESTTETVMLGVDNQGQHQQEPLKVHITRESENTLHVRNAERIALDGKELMQNQTARTILMLLGYEAIGDEVPVELDARLENR